MTRPEKWFLSVLAFVSGACVMTVEMAGQRSLAPHFGSSYYIWTNVIAVILAAMSAGYYFGGRIADRRPSLPVLLAIVAAAGVVCMAVSFLVGPLGDALAPDGTGMSFSFRIMFLGSFVASLLLFAPPVFLLAMVTPFIARLLATCKEDVGRSAGLVIALSTAGSIVGTFLPTLFVMPAFGTRLTMVAAAAAMEAVAAAGFALFAAGRAKKTAPLLLLPVLPSLLVNETPIKPSAGMIEEKESRYQYVQVRKEGNAKLLTLNEGLDTWHSVLVDGKYLTEGRYYDYFNLIPLHFNPLVTRKLRVLVIGLAGGTISRQLHHFFSGLFDLEVDGVEIDPAVVETGRKHFDLESDSNRNLRITVADGRAFLKAVDRTYDIIFVDAYSQQIYIPFYMTTREFFMLARKRLSVPGFLSINVCEFAETSPSLAAIRATMAEAFGKVFQVKVMYAINYLLYAPSGGLAPDDAQVRANMASPAFFQRSESAELRAIAEYSIAVRKTFAFSPADKVLTDDDAPIEALMDKSYRQMRSRLTVD